MDLRAVCSQLIPWIGLRRSGVPMVLCARDILYEPAGLRLPGEEIHHLTEDRVAALGEKRVGGAR